jgi:hypothetical protein
MISQYEYVKQKCGTKPAPIGRNEKELNTYQYNRCASDARMEHLKMGVESGELVAGGEYVNGTLVAVDGVPVEGNDIPPILNTGAPAPTKEGGAGAEGLTGRLITSKGSIFSTRNLLIGGGILAAAVIGFVIYKKTKK